MITKSNNPSTFADHFAALGLIEPICRALASESYLTPTPIQAQSIPHLLKGGDLLGCAQTGTGKTAAFALPILQRLSTPNKPKQVKARALILTPTRELAIQIGENLAIYGRHLDLNFLTIFGGVSDRSQIRMLKTGADIIVATPGRLLDLCNRKFLDLSGIEIFVLDEADRMLDMGFIRDVKKILPLIPKARQTLLFSATMPKEVKELAMGILKDPLCIAVAPVSSTADRVEEQFMYVEKDNKRNLLLEILKDAAIKRVLIFTRTKHGANRLTDTLEKAKIRACAIHGNKSQGARQKALEDFRAHKVRVLVATDIFARGIDIEDITHVINYELPNIPESYVHRIGRTARAGASGVAISFCDKEERAYLQDIEKMLKRSVNIVKGHAFESLVPLTDKIVKPVNNQRQSRPRQQSRSYNGGVSRNNTNSRSRHLGR
jgi:ATP-dependent RNA helicase RhlE